MKKLLLLLAILPFLVSCQNKKLYPELVDKTITYSDDDFNKEHFQVFSIYETATTKNSKLTNAKKSEDNAFPWSVSVTKKRTEKTLDEIQKSIQASSGPVLSYENSSGSIVFTALVSNYYSQNQISEYKKTGMITNEVSILDYVKAKVKSYELVSEKNKKIRINQEELGLKIGGFEEKNNILLQFIGFETMGLSEEYATLNGFIEIEVSIPTAYEKHEITINSIGEKFAIGDEKVQILEFDANVLHYKNIGSNRDDFSYYIVGSSNSQSVQIPETIYEKLRKNQGLDYNNFAKRIKEFGFDRINDSNEKNFVTIVKNDDYKLERVFFYKPITTQIEKRTIKIPVNIESLDNN